MAFTRLSSFEGTSPLDESDAGLVGRFFDDLEGRWTLGMAGLMGTAGKTGWAVVEAFGVVC